MNMISIIEAIILIAVFALVILMTISIFISIITETPFVPSGKKIRRQMVELAELRPRDIVYDLGCGDATILIEAKRTADITARGYEISPMVYLLARLRIALSGVKGIELHMKNFFNVSLKDADVVFCYLMPNIMKQLGPKLAKECKPGCRVISHAFQMKEWEPVRLIPRDRAKGQPTVYRYEIGRSNMQTKAAAEKTATQDRPKQVG